MGFLVLPFLVSVLPFLHLYPLLSFPIHSFQIVANQPYDKVVDWWSYGVLLYEMLAGQVALHPDSYRALSLHCWFFVIPSNKLSKEVWFQDSSLSVCSQCLNVIVLFFSPFSLPASIWRDWRGGAVSVDHGTERLLPEKPVSGSHCNLQGSKSLFFFYIYL